MSAPAEEPVDEPECGPDCPGWALFDTGPGAEPEILRCDECAKLPDDDAARTAAAIFEAERVAYAEGGRAAYADAARALRERAAYMRSGRAHGREPEVNEEIARELEVSADSIRRSATPSMPTPAGVLDDGTRWCLGSLCVCGRRPCRGGVHPVATSSVTMVLEMLDGAWVDVPAIVDSPRLVPSNVDIAFAATRQKAAHVGSPGGGGGLSMAGKPMTQTDHIMVKVAFDSLSKNALADLTLDLLRRCAGNEIDGADAVQALREAFEPIRVVRDDRPVPILQEYQNARGWAGWTTRRHLDGRFKFTGRTA